MSRLILVGEAPGGVSELPPPLPVTEDFWHSLHLTGAVGRRMAELAGCGWLAYLARTCRTNLFFTAAEGVNWKKREAKKRAEALAQQFRDGDRVILLGAKVAEAFGVEKRALFCWSTELIETGSVRVARCPHPSGRNRLLNDEAMREQFADFLRDALK